MLPAPEIDAFSVCATRTTTWPTPLTSMRARSLARSCASYSAAPEIETRCSVASPASRALSAPSPLMRSSSVESPSRRTELPPDAAMLSARVCNPDAVSRTAPDSAMASTSRYVTVTRTLPPPPRPINAFHQRRVSRALTCSVPSRTLALTRAPRAGASMLTCSALPRWSTTSAAPLTLTLWNGSTSRSTLAPSEAGGARPRVHQVRARAITSAIASRRGSA